MDLDLTEQVCSILQLTCFRMRLCHGLPGHAGSFLVPNLPSTLRLCWSSWSRSARSFELHPGPPRSFEKKTIGSDVAPPRSLELRLVAPGREKKEDVPLGV